jgi:hypothetical protein
MVHLLPFHRSASGALSMAPTAVQAAAEPQETPAGTNGPLADVPDVVGKRWIVHRVPFHCSAMACAPR